MKPLERRLEDARVALAAAREYRETVRAQVDHWSRILFICEDGINQQEERIEALKKEVMEAIK